MGIKIGNRSLQGDHLNHLHPDSRDLTVKKKYYVYHQTSSRPSQLQYPVVEALAVHSVGVDCPAVPGTTAGKPTWDYHGHWMVCVEYLQRKNRKKKSP